MPIPKLLHNKKKMMDSTSCKTRHRCYKGNTAHAVDMVETKNMPNSEMLFHQELVLFNKILIAY